MPATAGNTQIEYEELDDFDDDTLGIFEWSAPPNAPITDRDGWAHANPSLGYGFMTERSLASACATDPPDEFKTECLCQWVTSTVAPPFPVGSWDAGKDENSVIAEESPLYFGIDVAADRLHARRVQVRLRLDREVAADGSAELSGRDQDRAAE